MVLNFIIFLKSFFKFLELYIIFCKKKIIQMQKEEIFHHHYQFQIIKDVNAKILKRTEVQLKNILI